jgi:hypothetical protein
MVAVVVLVLVAGDVCLFVRVGVGVCVCVWWGGVATISASEAVRKLYYVY